MLDGENRCIEVCLTLIAMLLQRFYGLLPSSQTFIQPYCDLFVGCTLYEQARKCSRVKSTVQYHFTGKQIFTYITILWARIITR